MLNASPSPELSKSEVAANKDLSYEMLASLANAPPDPYHTMTLSAISAGKREHFIGWMNKTCNMMLLSPEVESLSIQIFDKFLFSHSFKDTDSVKVWGLACAASLVIGSKLSGSKRRLMPSSFSNFYKTAEIVVYERLVLNSINFEINPMNTPVEIMKMMMLIWPAGHDNHIHLLTSAYTFLSEFRVYMESIKYTPSTLAVAAILQAFREIKSDPIELLQQLPTTLLMCEMEGSASIIDCQKSLAHFFELDEPFPIIRDFLTRHSPVSHIDLHDLCPLQNRTNCSNSETETQICHDFSPIKKCKFEF